MRDTALPPGPLDGGRLRSRVAAGEATMGTFVNTASPVTAEAVLAIVQIESVQAVAAAEEIASATTHLARAPERQP
jgi:2-keto-3-deoxy-L-rhamnonate aldolase RhmA